MHGVCDMNRRMNWKTGNVVNEETFTARCQDVVKMNVNSPASLCDIVSKLKCVFIEVTAESAEWEARVKAMKSLCAVPLAGATESANFLSLQQSLINFLQTLLRENRSKVVMEACFTTAYLAKELGIKFP